MKRSVILSGVLCCFMLAGAAESHAEKWVKNSIEPSKNIEAVFYDSDSIKSRKKTVLWTEKYVLTANGSKVNTDGLLKYEACKKNIQKKGNVTNILMNFEMESGKFRTVALKNLNKANELICTDKDMGTELNKSWATLTPGTPMYEMFYKFVAEYKMGNILE